MTDSLLATRTSCKKSEALLSTTFVSKVSEYDLHEGTVRMADLPTEQQDELIHLIFDTEGDYRKFVIEHNIHHLQPDGLWMLVVALGLHLERLGAIVDFSLLTQSDCDEIINTIAGTNLWLRLEEAFPPFDNYYPKSSYDWAEIEYFGAPNSIAEFTEGNARAKILGLLDFGPTPQNAEYLRLPYQDYLRGYQEGRLVSTVNRNIALQTFEHSNQGRTKLLAPVHILGLILFLPILIFLNVWAGLVVLLISIAAKRLLSVRAVKWFREYALSNRERFRFYSSRKAIWARSL